MGLLGITPSKRCIVFACVGMAAKILSSIKPLKPNTVLIIDSDKRCAALPVGATKEISSTCLLLLLAFNINNAASNLVTV